MLQKIKELFNRVFGTGIEWIDTKTEKEVSEDECVTKCECSADLETHFVYYDAIGDEIFTSYLPPNLITGQSYFPETEIYIGTL